MRWIADQQLDLETKIRDLVEIFHQHIAIAGKTDPLTVVSHVVVHESGQIGPILPVEAGEIIYVEIRQFGFVHSDSLSATTIFRPPRRSRTATLLRWRVRRRS